MAGAGRLADLGDSVRQRFDAACPAGPVVVALSGGADSAVCAWAAVQSGRAVRALFVHHGLPGSDGLESAARAIAGMLGVSLATVRVGAPGGLSSEAQARAARLAALEEGRDPGEHVLTGHTADDQAETVLGNLLRGAGAAGLAGIPPRRDPWVRPLLQVTRAETRELAGLLRLPYDDDPANAGDEARRNVLRRDVLPDLEARFNTELRAALNRTARALRADDDELAAAAARVPVRIERGTARLPAPLLVTLPTPVAARAVREALRRLHPPYPGAAADVAAALAVAGGEGGRAGLTGGLLAEREGPWLLLHQPAADTAWPAFAWAVPGTATIPGFRLDAWVTAEPPAPWPLGTATLVLDADCAGADLELRPAGSGERIDIGTGSKPVREALAEAGVPARRRHAWPVLAVGGALVCVAGVRVAAWARPGPESKRFLWVATAMEVR